jgi:Calcineurin-like phosphoesterase
MLKCRIIMLAAVAGTLLLAGILAAQTQPSAASWQFAVSGDSRNCGDVVMPAIAADLMKHNPSFYWHLGDFRATYTFDEDILHQPANIGHPPNIYEYLHTEWQDFLDSQIAAFGDLPVYLGIGNHETIFPKTREEYIAQFADWLDTPALRAQRLQDDPRDHRLHIYYHWRERNVDFINLDNASEEQFDEAQVAWFERTLARDVADSSIATIVIGMHEALPDSISEAHSMSQSAAGVESGRRVYQDLLRAEKTGRKRIYVLASHSHFYMVNIFNTEYVKQHGGVLPGWIIGTAGAFRYSLPPNSNLASAAETNVYGYLLANVKPDGSIDFQFQKLEENSVPGAIVDRYKQEFIHWCWTQNSMTRSDPN